MTLLSTRRQIPLSLLGGFVLFVSCIVLTWLASDRFGVEGPDTPLSSILSYSWVWAYVLARPLAKIVPSGQIYYYLIVLTTGVFVEALIIFGVLRAIAAWKRKNATLDRRNQTRCGRT